MAHFAAPTTHRGSIFSPIADLYPCRLIGGACHTLKKLIKKIANFVGPVSQNSSNLSAVSCPVIEQIPLSGFGPHFRIFGEAQFCHPFMPSIWLSKATPLCASSWTAFMKRSGVLILDNLPRILKRPAILSPGS